MTAARSVTIWDLMTMCMWSVLFAVGLVPELVFHGLRSVSGVTTYIAFVNSSAIITFSLAGYVAFFVARQCRESGMGSGAMQTKAIHAALISVIAFMEIPGQSPIFGTQTLLGLMIRSSLQPERSLRILLWVVGCTKLTAWVYLYALMLKFHVFGVRTAFNRIPSLFIQMHDKES